MGAFFWSRFMRPWACLKSISTREGSRRRWNSRYLRSRNQVDNIQYSFMAQVSSLLASQAVQTLLVFLGSLLAACLIIFAVARLVMNSWERSLTRQMETYSLLNDTLERFCRPSGDMQLQSTESTTSAYSGSSNSQPQDDHTSTFIPILESSDTGSARHGIELPEMATQNTSKQERASNDYGQAEKAKQAMRSNMHQKMNKKPCRLCSKVRKLVDFGQW